MSTAPKFTPDELAFVKRMAFHVETGLSPADAANAVIEDDARIIAAFFKRSISQYMPTADERGRSHTMVPQIGDLMASELSSRVYASLRAEG